MKKKKPLISILTATLNSEDKIKFLINSIINQKYKNIELIIIDSSKNNRMRVLLKRYSNKINIRYFKKYTNIYGALNFGIKKSKGDLVNFIGSDDCYYSNNIFKLVSKKKIDQSVIYYGDTIYYKNSFTSKTRYYKSGNVNEFKFYFGFMPSHTSCFFTKGAINKIKFYDKKFLIASDFDFIVRSFKKKVKFENLNKIITKMSEGGISNKSIKNILLQNLEINKILKKNKINSFFFLIIIKLFIKFICKNIYKINLKRSAY